MFIITIGNEKNLDQLIEKRFTGLSAAETKRVREATLKANPHLREAVDLKSGMVVVLPETRKPAAKLAASHNTAPSETVDHLVEALKRYTPQLMSALEEAQSDLDQSAKLMKSAAFKKALDGASKEIASQAKELDVALKSEIEANSKTRESLPGEVETLRKGLSGLIKKLA